MVNGCLAYGVELTKEQLAECVEKVCQLFGEEDTNKLRQLLKGDIPDNEQKVQRCNDSDDDSDDDVAHNDNESYVEECEPFIDRWALHDEFARFFKLIEFSVNGACCNVDEEYEYFIGWKSEGNCTSEFGSFEIVPPTEEKRKLIDTELAKYSKKNPKYYIMADDCESCS